MGLFRRRPEAEPERVTETEQRSTIDLSRYAQLWADVGGVYSPMYVGPDRALTMAACWSCVDVLATAISTTPVDVVRYVGKSRQEVTPTPTLIAAPSAVIDQDVWLYQLIESMCTDGNAFGIVYAADAMGRPTRVEIVAPSTVTERKVVDGVPQAKVNGDIHRLFPFGDLFHVPGKMTRAGSVFGENVLDKAQATIGAALAAREYSTRTFGDGGVPVGRWKSDTQLDAGQAEQVKAVLRRVTSGSREPIVTGTGLEWESLSIDMEQTQFLDVMKFAIEEACRFFRVPPAMVYAATSGQSVTYANVSQADLGFLKWSVDGYMVRVERKLTGLIGAQQFVKFNRNAFLRADAETRSQIVDRRLRNKTMTINEARALEDEPPFSGDEYNLPGLPGEGSSSRSLSVAEVAQKVYLPVVNGVMTPDEARQMINDAGGELDIPGPFGGPSA